MKLPRWILPALRDGLARRRAAPEVRLQVKNLTRQTILANCLEVADSGPKRNKGLLGRKGLSPGEGMWILPCESVHTFGMQFPIDLVYLDRKHQIRKVRSNVRPWRISACLSAHSVIELPSGTVHATESKPGDTLEFSAAPPPDVGVGGIAADSESSSPLTYRQKAT
jgi:uncharacterized membrane protein (UPF0127 family)